MSADLDDLIPLFRHGRALAWDHYRQLQRAADRQILLTARSLGESLRARKSIPHLSDVEFRVYSQTGEDGIIEWLLQNLPIRSESFIEFGVEDYVESNTRYLMRHRNWRGLVLDANVSHVEAIRGDDIYWQHDLVAKSSFITKENINETISSSSYHGDIGLLSIDIDGNDYWIFDAINVVNPDIVICEYNAVLGDVHALTIPYDPTFQRSLAHHSWLYFGASIRALERAAARKGYTLIGSNGAGHNAFFVRADLASHLSIADRSARPSHFRESRNEDGSLSHVGGLDRAALIADMPVLDLETGRTAPLGGFGNLYSPAWRGRLGPG